MEAAVASIHKGIAAIDGALEDSQRGLSDPRMDAQLRREKQFQLAQLTGLAALAIAGAVVAEEERKEEGSAAGLSASEPFTRNSKRNRWIGSRRLSH